ncbi:PilW family protein [Alkalilimnicola ehrlichii MLHE-1]|uniref:Prepilin-type cleavage/methylation-like protein n=1 Tax=Alkalilimnicola ehrlichii (strain ATCC BAA-1101 / DSM 17681 / MLHE-1) TaxID=187272 RepID=Q0AC27_ALKEH|nr:prepilin-type N-terminal cleavage/methylation domain-containing protein [Alkalilimnicola ehrlichii]ABI55610.1 Prepilin-type cleavage/methylation-like protein [Alkalilimnicola ehrlichii MLHE-1]
MTRYSYRRHKGFSLVELMIGLLIGTLLVGGVVAVFVNAMASFERQREVDRSQESLRYAVNFLVRELRQVSAGGGDFGVVNPGLEVEAAPDAARGHRITVRYQVFDDGEAQSCRGDDLAEGDEAEKSFFVGTPTGEPLLICEDDDGETPIAFGLNALTVVALMVDDNQDGDYEVEDDPDSGWFDGSEALDDVIGLRLEFGQQWVDEQTRPVEVTVGLRNRIFQRLLE